MYHNPTSHSLFGLAPQIIIYFHSEKSRNAFAMTPRLLYIGRSTGGGAYRRTERRMGVAIDSGILRRAMDAYEEEKSRRSAELTERRERLYARFPRLGAIDEELRVTVLELVSGTFGGGEAEAPEDLRDRNLALQAEYSEILVSAGYGYDYLNDTPACAACADHGFLDGRVCDCLMERYRKEQLRELRDSLSVDASFDSFELDYYSDECTGGMGVREYMELVYETCLSYARRFGGTGGSLLMLGEPGVGKTYLSACIARVAAENGYSVIYDTAVGVFSVYEEERFSRNPDAMEELRKRTGRLADCDLLVIDDLGSEMNTSFVGSVLYTLIGGRLNARRSTIINTNLSMEELRRRYTAQTMSRIENDYRVVRLKGKDIRAIRRGKG